MAVWKIPTYWEMTGNIEIEADTLEDAIDYLEENLDDYDLPSESEYITDSIGVYHNMKYTRSINE